MSITTHLHYQRSRPRWNVSLWIDIDLILEAKIGFLHKAAPNEVVEDTLRKVNCYPQIEMTRLARCPCQIFKTEDCTKHRCNRLKRTQLIPWTHEWIERHTLSKKCSDRSLWRANRNFVGFLACHKCHGPYPWRATPRMPAFSTGRLYTGTDPKIVFCRTTWKSANVKYRSKTEAHI